MIQTEMIKLTKFNKKELLEFINNSITTNKNIILSLIPKNNVLWINRERYLISKKQINVIMKEFNPKQINYLIFKIN